MTTELKTALFIDRDGTLMEEVDHCCDPAQVRAYPGAAEDLERARTLGWLVIIVTNQSGIGRGYFTVEQFESVQRELIRQLGGFIDASYMAPDHPDNPSPRRKPSPGMLLEAAAEHGIDLSASWMIGDKDIDLEAGRRAGCKVALVRTGYGTEVEADLADLVAADLPEALERILAQWP